MEDESSSLATEEPLLSAALEFLLLTAAEVEDVKFEAVVEEVGTVATFATSICDAILLKVLVRSLTLIFSLVLLRPGPLPILGIITGGSTTVSFSLSSLQDVFLDMDMRLLLELDANEVVDDVIFLVGKGGGCWTSSMIPVDMTEEDLETDMESVTDAPEVFLGNGGGWTTGGGGGP